MIRRLSAAVAAVVLVGTATSGCSTFSKNSDAARAGGESLSIDDFETILEDYTAAQAPPGTDDTTTTTAFEIPGSEGRSLLTRWVRSHLLFAALADAGQPIDDATRAAAETAASTSVGESWAGLSAQTKQLLTDEQTATDALNSGSFVTEEESRLAYDSGIAVSNTLCMRVILFPDEAAANEASQQLTAGADFAELANENSTEANGGILSSSTGSECLAANEVNEIVTQALLQLPIGQASAPVELTGSDGSTQFFLVMQRPWDEVSAAALPIVRQRLAAAKQQEFLGGGGVQVDSRYGTWDAELLEVVAAR